LEATAARRSKLQLECHHTSGKAFIKAMKDWYKFSNWKSTKSTKDNRNIGPQTEPILLVFFDIPCFFSRTELEVFLGYKSPNHNVDGASTKMVEAKMLIIAANKVGTEVYYLGNFGRQSLQRYNLPNVDYKPDQCQASIVIRADNGHRVRNKRQATARSSSDNKQQESLTKKRVVSHHRQQKRLKPIRIHPYSPPKKKSPNAPLSNPPNQSTVNLTVLSSLIHPMKILPVTTSLKIQQ
jgi:hypothetical protein